MGLTILFLVISFAAKACMDISAKDGFGSTWMNKNMSWRLKYDPAMIPNYKHWYYWGTIAFKERFMFSTTMLVFVVDGWHLFQMVFLKCFMIAIAINMPYLFIYNLLIVNAVYAVVFNLVYSIKKK